MSNPRKVTLNALLNVRNSAYSNVTLNKILAEADLTAVDRAFVTACFYGVLDRTITLDYVISQHIKTSIKKVQPTALEILRLALYQIMYMDKIPNSAAVDEAVKLIKNSKYKHLSGFINGVLRNILRSEIVLPNSNDVKSLSVRFSCPEWIVESFITDYGVENAVALLERSLCSPPVILRVNTLKTDTLTLAERLKLENADVETLPFENALKVVGGIDVAKSKSYKEGLFHVQDIASQTAVKILSPLENENVLDICAAPGGKTFTMAQYMKNTGKIVACDLYEKRLQLIKVNAARLGITNITVLQNDATVNNDSFGEFDAVLCDVVCSGLGVIRRKPEIKYKDISEYADITAVQYKILENAASYLKPGGKILYSTCTLRKCENEGVVNAFLDKRSGFELKYQRTFMPHIDGTDGFYCALLQKSR